MKVNRVEYVELYRQLSAVLPVGQPDHPRRPTDPRRTLTRLAACRIVVFDEIARTRELLRQYRTEKNS